VEPLAPDWPRLWRYGMCALPHPPWPWPPTLCAPVDGVGHRGLATHDTGHTPSARLGTPRASLPSGHGPARRPCRGCGSEARPGRHHGRSRARPSAPRPGAFAAWPCCAPQACPSWADGGQTSHRSEKTPRCARPSPGSTVVQPRSVGSLHGDTPRSEAGMGHTFRARSDAAVSSCLPSATAR
jgi:hypothetical protein